jgi:hypothetical protein
MISQEVDLMDKSALQSSNPAGHQRGQWICGEGGKLRAGAKRRPHRFKPEAAAGANDETLVMDPTISIRDFRMWH